MIPRIYLPLPLKEGEPVELEKHIQHYLTRTLRLRINDPVIVFTGKENGEWQGKLITTKPNLTILIEHFITKNQESPLNLTLVQGVSKLSSLELSVQKSVELGVHRIIPLICQRSLSLRGSGLTDNKRHRLKRIAEEAAEQSERTNVPTILQPQSWEQLSNHLDPGLRVLFKERSSDEQRLMDQPKPKKNVTLLVGPEGGFEENEIMYAKQTLMCVTVSLGPRILRTETAAIAAMSCCQMLWGDL